MSGYQEKKYNYIYKIINLTNNKFYIGAHSTNNLDDNYMGSGILIKRTIKKEGVKNFKKEILFYLDSAKEMYDKEREVVILCEESYNLTSGGGFPLFLTPEILLKKSLAQQGEKNSQFGTNCFTDGETTIRLFPGEEIPEGFYLGATYDFKNRKVRKGKEHQTFGWPWFTNGKSSKQIHPADPIPEGFYAGRYIDPTWNKAAPNSPKGEDCHFTYTTWITNGIENRNVKKALPVPKGFWVGKTMPTGWYWTTNGVERHQQYPNEPLLPGYYKGLPAGERYRIINDGIKNMNLKDGLPLPEGFTYGRMKSYNITNGFENKKLPLMAAMPEGFYKGTTKLNK